LPEGEPFGDNRVICNFHWQSDVDEARVLGAAVVARLHADPVFRADLEAARTELTPRFAPKGFRPTRGCKAEAAALAQHPKRTNTEGR